MALIFGAVGCVSVRAAEQLSAPFDIPVAVEESVRPVSSRDIVTLREIGGDHGTGLSMSPDGNYLAFELHQADIIANNYRVAWFVVATRPGAHPVKIGDGGDGVLFRSSEPNGRINGAWRSQYARWSPDSRGIAYRRTANKETQVWWSALNAKQPKQLTHNAADVEDFCWSPDGLRLFFTTDADREELVKVAESRYREGYIFNYGMDWSVVGGKPMYPPYTGTGGEPRLWVLDLETGRERRAGKRELAEYEQLEARPESKLEEAENARNVVSTSNRDAIAWLVPASDAKTGRNAPLTLYASLRGDGGDAVRCLAPECTGIFDLSRPLGTGLLWTSTDDEILFVRKAGTAYSKRELYGWRVGQDHARRILSTDEWISDCSVRKGEAFCFREAPDYPRTIVSIDLADGAISTLADPNPEFRNLAIGEVELLEWTNAHGLETFAYLVKPPNFAPGQRYPLIIVGYRARMALRGGAGNEYPVHVLTENGFVVLVYERPTNYAAEGSITDPIGWSEANWGPDLFDYRMPLASFESAIRLLDEIGLVDPARVGVTGLSNGVGHVNYSLIHSDLFAAAITSDSGYGPSNYFLVGSADPLFRRHRNTIGLGRYGSRHGFLWHHISLGLNAKHVTTPLLVNASDSEHPWALEEVITLIENDKPVEMVVYPDEWHIKWQPAHRLSVYERNIDWFNFWLREFEDQQPSKADQYRRWRELKSLQLGIESGEGR
jgi:dipeptidyl aminopeptidase/acylaminoacyl peptidase